MKQYLALFVIGTVLVLLAGCGGGRNNPADSMGRGGGQGGSQASMQKPEKPSFKIPVTAQPVERGRMVSYLQAVGTVVPIREVEIKPEMTGRIYYTQKWMEGDRVEEGEVIARMDDRQLRLDIDDAELSLKLARAALGPASAELQQAYKNEEFNEAMYERGAISKAEFDQAVLARIQQEHAYEQALSTVETRQVALDKLLEQLDEVEIKAPFTGVLLPPETSASGGASEGSKTDLTLLNNQMVSQGTVICRLADINEVYVALDVPAKDLTDIEIGQPVELEVYAKNSNDYLGHVEDISTALDSTTRTYTVNVLVENPDKALRPGMFAKARIITEEKRDAISIPRELVMLRNNQSVVFVVTPQEPEPGTEAPSEDAPPNNQLAMAGASDNSNTAIADEIPSGTEGEPGSGSTTMDDREWVAERRIIQTGIENVDKVEVVDGLREGDLLVVLGYETLTDGVDVNVSIRPSETAMMSEPPMRP